MGIQPLVKGQGGGKRNFPLSLSQMAILFVLESPITSLPFGEISMLKTVQMLLISIDRNKNE
jgi:hypothetical protein